MTAFPAGTRLHVEYDGEVVDRERIGGGTSQLPASIYTVIKRPGGVVDYFFDVDLPRIVTVLGPALPEHWPPQPNDVWKVQQWGGKDWLYFSTRRASKEQGEYDREPRLESMTRFSNNSYTPAQLLEHFVTGEPDLEYRNRPAREVRLAFRPLVFREPGTGLIRPEVTS